jgi:hypothetical protein
MNKAHIIAEIKRTAAANGGKPLGKSRFEQATGIKIHEWCGKFWARWGDALQEAGFKPNALNTAYDRNAMMEQIALFTRELGRFPVPSELQMRSRQDGDFPGYAAILRVGKKPHIVKMVVEFCSNRDDFNDVLEICRPLLQPESDAADSQPKDDPTFGHVYLMKSGKHYKVGHSNSAGRREYELAIQLPERLTTVHTISTDDPVGIEAYWHKRFDAKRLNGEWFNLDPTDIRAFKRRKFM